MRRKTSDPRVDLLRRARGALGLDKAGFAAELGVSRKTLHRWETVAPNLDPRGWTRLAEAVRPENPSLAAKLAVHGTAPSAPQPARATGTEDLVALVVYAAAEAAALPPQAVRPAVHAAFARAIALGLGLHHVRDALGPAAAPERSAQ